jgi:hypothetical protein
MRRLPHKRTTTRARKQEQEQQQQQTRTRTKTNLRIPEARTLSRVSEILSEEFRTRHGKTPQDKTRQQDNKTTRQQTTRQHFCTHLSPVFAWCVLFAGVNLPYCHKQFYLI